MHWVILLVPSVHTHLELLSEVSLATLPFCLSSLLLPPTSLCPPFPLSFHFCFKSKLLLCLYKEDYCLCKSCYLYHCANIPLSGIVTGTVMLNMAHSGFLDSCALFSGNKSHVNFLCAFLYVWVNIVERSVSKWRTGRWVPLLVSQPRFPLLNFLCIFKAEIKRGGEREPL